jgi:predicted dehydrogenase
MQPKRIAIVGAGGMAREIASALRWINRSDRRFELLGYVVSDLSRLGRGTAAIKYWETSAG